MRFCYKVAAILFATAVGQVSLDLVMALPACAPLAAVSDPNYTFNAREAEAIEAAQRRLAQSNCLSRWVIGHLLGVPTAA